MIPAPQLVEHCVRCMGSNPMKHLYWQTKYRTCWMRFKSLWIKKHMPNAYNVTNVLTTKWKVWALTSGLSTIQTNFCPYSHWGFACGFCPYYLVSVCFQDNHASSWRLDNDSGLFQTTHEPEHQLRQPDILFMMLNCFIKRYNNKASKSTAFVFFLKPPD